jgi:hypothetical protein
MTDPEPPLLYSILAALAVVVSIPVTRWLATLVGPVLFPFPEWRRDDSPIILAWLLMQGICFVAIAVLWVRTARRRNRGSGAR